ncbi:DUF4123 domain-containing protein [Inquilinus sp. Marseille-Q2685]|uniref:DUF4123 domain-containing protein n=1 Tax=Inquilinus sp. Marseille-Q2685 TaxID=2866581 RepID=UPI001CE40E0C|nr:DUF4123 domain-containing protein [Inquilinus sp. Marseille-Q2685]
MMQQAVLDFLEAERAAVGDGTARLYVVADCGRDRNIRTLLQALAEESACLYQGEALAEYGDEAPWLATAGPHAELWTWLIEEGLGQRWGVFLASRRDFDAVRRHLRRFVKIRTWENQLVFFRFFDPFVWNSQVGFFSEEQRRHLFDGIDLSLTELGDKGFMRLRLEADARFASRIIEPKPEGGLETTDRLQSLPGIDLTNSGIRPYLTLAREQMEAPLLFNRPMLIEHVLDHLRPDHRQRMSFFPEGALRSMINRGVELAFSYGITDLAHIRLFCDLMWRMAPGFHRQQQINAVLRRTDLPAGRRFDILADDRYADAWVEAEGLRDFKDWFPNLPRPPETRP